MASKSNPKELSGKGRSLRRAIVDSFVKLDPRHMMGNPVMFVVEVGSVITTVLLYAAARSISVSTCRSRCGCGLPCCSPTSPKPWPKAAARRRPTPCAKRARRPLPIAVAGTAKIETVPSSKLRTGDVVGVSPASSSLPTARSSKALLQWMSRPSPASLRR